MIDMKPLPVIGIPRALLYYRSGTLWKAFFEAMGVPVVLSPPTSREILDIGSSLAVDETCLSAKIFIGHVRSLLGTCDRIFVPRYSSCRRNELFCTRFEGLPGGSAPLSLLQRRRVEREPGRKRFHRAGKRARFFRSAEPRGLAPGKTGRNG